MLFSRWKVMSGVIGISIGGLAALAGQSPKPDVVVSAPVLPAVKPMPSELPPAPTVPPIALPSVPTNKPAVELPSLPVPESKPQETKLPLTKPDVSALPAKGEITGLTPAGVFTPDLDVPVRAVPYTPPVTPSLPAAPVVPPAVFTPPSTKAIPTVPGTPSTLPSTPPITITSVETTLPTIETPTAPKPAATVQTKFRIILRVGEGEPTFEVRHNDDLVMKVACDKVDIKSPEKGSGPSNVIATGKVRFVGFGAEGTCESLSFLAGTGEVALSGNVNVKVRDKIGRVESELNADKMQYKLDQSALTGVLKP